MSGDAKRRKKSFRLCTTSILLAPYSPFFYTRTPTSSPNGTCHSSLPNRPPGHHPILQYHTPRVNVCPCRFLLNLSTRRAHARRPNLSRATYRLTTIEPQPVHPAPPSATFVSPPAIAAPIRPLLSNFSLGPQLLAPQFISTSQL